ncbi:H+/Cl- antiporter ClcA [Anaerovirgula multivorans]|uniref:H+/Cl- antiporter ClcA n=1 Tax=Anaerovirgula multivorans TaxID=312168 RepID=A0A239H8B6_9FIRM|nr:ClC family H(+)/Cl(-) exchange transporter [Anaerovirgula multivorans]SNS77617.1 H+/Cl- antiporter ClcA [Anaerovirgula multivorans]
MDSIHKNDTYNTLSHWQNFRLKLLVQGIIVGIFSGFLIVFYRIALEKAEELRPFILSLAVPKYILIPIWLLFLIILAYIVGVLIKKEPLISGSGIPQVEGVLLRKINMNWLSVIITKFIGGVISIGAGLSLGREGPSIQLGATMGQGVSKIFKRIKIEEKYLITSGASAGLAAAFNAPLAGVMFALEEVHKHFSPLILLSAMSASLTADFISKHFFGLKPVFTFNNVLPLPLESYGYIVFLGIIVGVFGAVFNSSLLKTQDIYAKQKWLPVKFRPMIPFLVAGLLAFTFPQVLGGGHSLIDSLINDNLTIKMLLIILSIKFIFSMISYGSGAPGGIFFPLLVLGALTGAVYGNILVHFFGFNTEYINNFIILAMAGYFTAIVRAPITGSILITEMTGSFSHLLSLSIISLVAYVVADLLKSEPIYESLLERLLKNNGIDEFIGDSRNKIVLEVSICIDSKMDGKAIKELKLPSNCLLVGIKRGVKELIPKGNTIIYSGDYLHVLVNENEAASTKEQLLEMSGKPIL